MPGWYFYIAQCSDDSLYSGISQNVEARIIEHNKGNGARYTRSRRPIKLAYHEPCGSESEARRREREVKAWQREKKLMLINGSLSA